MSIRKSITLRLEAEEYAQLEAEARRLGIASGSLARVYVRTSLGIDAQSESQRRYRAGVDALERLTALRAELRQAGYPSVDAVGLVEKGREKLGRRLVV